jgi:16S rRNA (uracil1498-N3)-methyltransferase
VIEAVTPRVMLRVDAISKASALPALTIASAVPKGDRADWLVEKLSEIGATRWVPLRTQRSVVHPEGVSKFDRWRRIALEAAKQSKRAGVMAIDELTPVAQLLKASDGVSAIVLSTSRDAVPIQSQIANHKSQILYIGPEGGWTDEEETLMHSAGLTAVTLGPTILRVETAAVVAAGVVRCLQAESS